MTWAEERETEAAELGYETSPMCVIIGGGQGGIALGARLRQLGVPTIIVERNDRPGDRWRNRYKSLCLHDPVWYDHLPYIKFPENWPVFTPKDKIGDWLEMYTKVMELNYWTRTICTVATLRRGAGEWTVVVERDGEQVDAAAEAAGAGDRHVGQAERSRRSPARRRFKGEQHHSSRASRTGAYDGQEGRRGRLEQLGPRHCAALWETRGRRDDGAAVARPTSCRSDTLMDSGSATLFRERRVASGVTTEKADLIFASMPYRILHEFQIPLYDEMKERDADFYDAPREGRLPGSTGVTTDRACS